MDMMHDTHTSFDKVCMDLLVSELNFCAVDHSRFVVIRPTPRRALCPRADSSISFYEILYVHVSGVLKEK